MAHRFVLTKHEISCCAARSQYIERVLLGSPNAKTLTNTFRLAWVCKDNLNRYSQDL